MNQEDEKLVECLTAVRWPLQYGTITVQVREGKPTLVKVEKTIKID